MNICVDFGHSGIKAMDENMNVVFIKNLISSEAVPADVDSFPGKFDPMDHCVVRYKKKEYAIGKHAENCGIVKQNTYRDDVLSEDTKMLITAAIAYLQKDKLENVNLFLNLPTSDYRRFKQEYIDRYEGSTLKIETYDYDVGDFVPKAARIKNLTVKAQGFYSMIDYVFDKEGKERASLRSKYRGLCAVVDIGYFSTDIVIMDDLKPRNNVAVNIDGMKKVYDNIAEKLKNNPKINLSKKAYEIENYILNNNCKVDFGTKQVDISRPVRQEYQGIVDQIVAELRNIVSTREVRTFFLTGGGAKPLAQIFDEEKDFQDKIEIIPQPRYANCRGGIKWGVINGAK